MRLVDQLKDARGPALLRRWDMRHRPADAERGRGAGWGPFDGLRLSPAESRDKPWVRLGEGVEVAFEEGASYRPGDYWLIPARVGQTALAGGWALGPDDDPKLPKFRPRAGPAHHYAPLLWFEKADPGSARDLRHRV